MLLDRIVISSMGHLRVISSMGHLRAIFITMFIGQMKSERFKSTETQPIDLPAIPTGS